MKNCISICFLALCGLVITLGNVQASPLNHSGKLTRFHDSSISVISNKPVGDEVVVNEPVQATETNEGQNETTAGEIPEENCNSFAPVCEESQETCCESTCVYCEDCAMTCCHRHCMGRRYWHRAMRISCGCGCGCTTWTSTTDCGCGM